MTTSFDDTAANYTEAVQDSIDFIGVEHEYFVRRKVDLLLGIVARHLGDPAGLTALDVGAGVGTTDTGLVDRFGRLRGCDPSARSVAVATTRNPTVDYLVADGTRLPYPDGSTDVAFTVNVLHHVDPPDRDRFVAEMARVTRSGGLVVAFEHNPLNPLTRRSVNACAFDEGVELLGRRELRRRFRAAGLDEVEHRYIVFTPFDVAWQHRLEDRLGTVPLGAQQYVAARRR